MSNKTCPCCQHQTLVETDFRGHEIDVCRQCGGMWFDHHELNDVLSAYDNGHDDVDFNALLGEPLGQVERACPCCSKPLLGYHLLKEYHVEIDVCHDCEGVWIDQCELKEVKESPRIKDGLDQLNKKVSRGSWIFQFLTMMPVEYNVKPHRTPWVTWSLIALNSVIFFAYFLDFELTLKVIDQFGSRPADFATGTNWWGPLTATFLHGSVMHLLGNMYFLYVVGDNIEDALGHWRFLAVYLLCGLGAGLISVLMNWGSTIPSVGASGAIAGLFALYILWFRHASLTFMVFVWQKKLSPVWYFAIWLALDLLGMIIGGDGVDHWAHIGGFFFGLAVAMMLKDWVFERNPLLTMLSSPAAKLQR